MNSYRGFVRVFSPINTTTFSNYRQVIAVTAAETSFSSFSSRRRFCSKHQYFKPAVCTSTPSASCSIKRSFSTTMGANGSKHSSTGKGKKAAQPEDSSADHQSTPASTNPQDPTTTTLQQQEQSAMATDSDSMIEVPVAKTTDLLDGQMLEVDVGDVGKALLVNQNGHITAIGNKCTHYGAPLAKGCLGDGRVRCPWHGACFNVGTGDIEDYPGLDNVPCYDVKVDGENIVIKADKNILKSGRRPVTIPPGGESKEDEVILIIGGGPASVVCIETLRQDGYQGKITLCSREDSLPYDRPKLSKAMHLSAANIALKPKTFYEELRVDLCLGKEVTKVNPAEKSVVLNDGSTLNYTTLLLATGAVPRTLPVPGFNEHVHLLREPSQANSIAAEAEGKKVVVIGTSFIGMEVAAYLSDKALSVECIGIAAVPFERVLGTRIGKALQQLLESKGVKFHLSAGVKEIVANDGKVTGVTLPSGDTIDADIVIAGVGVIPGTNFLKDSGLPMTGRGEVIVDKYMKVTDNIYAAGDIAQFPLPLTGDNVSIGHWQIAHNHGRVAARNIMGKEEAFNSVPYFWTVLFGKSLRYCGFALQWDEILFDGDPDELKFAAYFVQGEKVLAVSSLAMDPAVSTAAELMYQGRMPTASQLKNNIDIKSYLRN